MHLKTIKKQPLDVGYLLGHAVSGNTILLLGKPKQLLALDAATYELRYRLELSGSDSYSTVSAKEAVYFITRWQDQQYVIFAHAAADGKELWRTTLPLEAKAICNVFMRITAAGLLIFIEDHGFLLDDSNGKLLRQNVLPDSMMELSYDDGQVYARLKNGCGRVDETLDYIDLSTAPLFHICAAHGRLFGVHRAGRRPVELTADGERTLPDVGKIEHITPIRDGRLALRAKNQDRLTLFDPGRGEMTQTPPFVVEEEERPDGFGLSSVTEVKDGLVVVAYSIGSDEECGFYYHLPSQKIHPAFGKVKAKYFSVGDDIIQCGRKEISIYRVGV